jgi:cytoskeletal protein RodZ
MKKKTVCIALAVLAVALIAVALVLLLRKPGKTEPTATAPSENVPVTLPGQEELSITTAGDNAQPTDAQGVRPTMTATAGAGVTDGKTMAGTAGSAAATPTENGATTKKGATAGATTSEKEPAKSTTERTVSKNLKTENDSSAGKFGELF